jgi:hypothetical protein
MNAILRTKDFWRPYLTLEPEELSEDDLNAQLDGLRNDFTVRDEVVTFEEDGEEYTEPYRVAEFSFFCGPNFSLLLEYQPEYDGCSRHLYLVDERTGTKQQMGWWDLARWHPFCLRPSELDTLLSFWMRWDIRWPQPEVPLLLLCQFVGICDVATHDAMLVRVEAAYRALGLPEVTAQKTAVPLPLQPDSGWKHIPELGWVFTGDEYACYSLRNQTHSGSGIFPFQEFLEMMRQVEEKQG